MSDCNLHTCERSVAGAPRVLPCEACRNESDIAKFTVGMARGRVQHLPNFAVMTDAEVLGAAMAGGEYAAAAKHIYDCRAAIGRIVGAEFILRDLAKATTPAQLAVIQAAAKKYVQEVIAKAHSGGRG